MTEKMRIMIVEDEPITAIDQHEIFSGLGYAVTGIYFSAEVALQKIKQDKPDVVVMDIMLSGDRNGLDAAAEIRRDYQIPVIFVSAITNSLGELNSETSADVYFVQKPYTEKVLTTAIRRVLSK